MGKGNKRKSNQSNKNIIMIVGIVFVLCIAGFLIYTKLIHNDGEKGTFVDFSYYSDNYEEEGLLPKHSEEVGETLKKDNEVRRLALRSIKR